MRVRPRQSFGSRKKGENAVVNRAANAIANLQTERSNARPRAERSLTRPSALRHGAWSKAAVLPWEDARQFDRLCRDLVDEWSPAGPAEEDAVFTLAKCMWRKHQVRRADVESSTPMSWWLPEEIGFDERLDGLIDRALRRLAQMKAMKELLAVERNAPKALPHRRAEQEIEAAAVAVG